MSTPVTSSTTVNVAEVGIFCPHIDKNNIEGWRLQEGAIVNITPELGIFCLHIDKNNIEGWRLQEGAIVNITPEHPLFLCEQCWHAMRSQVLSSLVREGALAVARSGILRK